MTDIELAEPLTEPDPHEERVNRCVFIIICIAFSLFLALIAWVLHFGFTKESKAFFLKVIGCIL